MLCLVLWKKTKQGVGGLGGGGLVQTIQLWLWAPTSLDTLKSNSLETVIDKEQSNKYNTNKDGKRKIRYKEIYTEKDREWKLDRDRDKMTNIERGTK